MIRKYLYRDYVKRKVYVMWASGPFRPPKPTKGAFMIRVMSWGTVYSIGPIVGPKEGHYYFLNLNRLT